IVKPFRNEEVLARVGAHIAQGRTVTRVEQLLAQSGLAALAVDATGSITWMTEAAANLLGEECGGAGRMPPALFDFVLTYIGAGQSAPEKFFCNRISVKISP